MTETLIQAEHLSVDFGRHHGWLSRSRPRRVVDDVSLTIAVGETLGLVGESGGGKTTLGRALLRRVDAATGRIRFKGRDITQCKGEELRRLRKNMQMVFQNPFASLNPRMKVADIVAEPLLVHGLGGSTAKIPDKVRNLLALMGLPADAANRYPHSFSGGQVQRIDLARALVLDPDLIVADEPTSGLDMSLRAQIIKLMQQLQSQRGLGYLFISHDLMVVQQISSRIAVMFAGRIVEYADRDAIFRRTKHPYTEALISAVFVVDPEAAQTTPQLERYGKSGDPSLPASGCSYHLRCRYADRRCRELAPALEEKAPGHWAACWLR